MAEITKSRTLTYDGEEVYARTHIDVVDGLNKNLLLTPDEKEKLNQFSQDNLTVATTTKNGLMSSEDKVKLDSLNPNDMVHIEIATVDSAGLMSAEDKRRLDALRTNSNEFRNEISETSIDNNKLEQHVDVWPTPQQIVRFTKNVTSCRNGIIFVWRLDTVDDLYHYQYLPKIHVQRHSEVKISEVIPTNTTGQTCNKTIIVNDQSVRGVDDNNKNNANKIRLHEILEY